MEPINPVVLDNVFASDEDDSLPSGLHRLLQNKNGKSYIRGATYDLPTKLRVWHPKLALVQLPRALGQPARVGPAMPATSVDEVSLPPEEASRI
jgi:hypothetical protein